MYRSTVQPGFATAVTAAPSPSASPSPSRAPVPTPARLAVDLIEKRFGDNVVLSPIAFEVEAGQILAVLGASGCGKSTLLRAIAGLDQDWAGTIAVTPSATNRAPTIGVVYQEPRLMPWLTVEQNIMLALDGSTTQTKPPSQSQSQSQNASIDGLLQELCLEDARHCLPKQLSGGMAQRVAIARALMRVPDVLLLDEPFSALDVLTRRRLITLTREVTERHQTATVIVTHDPDEAVRLADRVIVLASDPSGDASLGATIQADFRPTADPAAIFRDVEGIIATLQHHVRSPRRRANVSEHDNIHLAKHPGAR
jgi:sulfonate transport system ATP-binding protein